MRKAFSCGGSALVSETPATSPPLGTVRMRRYTGVIGVARKRESSTQRACECFHA